MLKVIYDRYNNIDVLINNAGIAIDSLFEDKTKENFINSYVLEGILKNKVFHRKGK